MKLRMAFHRHVGWIVRKWNGQSPIGQSKSQYSRNGNNFQSSQMIDNNYRYLKGANVFRIDRAIANTSNVECGMFVFESDSVFMWNNSLSFSLSHTQTYTLQTEEPNLDLYTLDLGERMPIQAHKHLPITSMLLD